MFVNNARNYLELFALRSLSPEQLLRTIHVEGVEHLEAGLKQGKGVIIFAVHSGPFDYIVQYMGISGYDVTIPVERLKDQRMLDLILRLRGSHGMDYLPLGGSSPMRTMMQKLRDNKIVLIVADRAIEGQSIEVDFFGAPARLPNGPVRLAQRTGAVLVGAHCWRTPDGLARGEWVSLSLELPKEQRTDAERLMRAMIEKMEQFICQYPEQWIAFAPIWIADVKSDS
jgi:KDO2-lipid IV(A) lauroyltransferase